MLRWRLRRGLSLAAEEKLYILTFPYTFQTPRYHLWDLWFLIRDDLSWLVYITSIFLNFFHLSTCTTAGAAVTCTTGRTGGAYAERPVETTGPRLGVQVPCPSKSEELQQNINCPFYMVENYDFRIWTTASKKCGVDWLNATAVSSNFVFGPQTLQQASARDCQRLQNPRTMSIPS